MSMLILMILLMASGVILVHCVCVVAKLSRSKWDGHQGRFAGIAASIALMAGGAMGMLLAFPHAPILLTVGLAGSFIFERRGAC